MMIISLVVLLAVALAAPGLLIYQLNKKMYNNLAVFQEQLKEQRGGKN